MKKLHTLALAAYLCTAAALAAETLPPVQYTPNGAYKCPRDIDIKNMDTRMSALVVPAKNLVALQHERAKAVTCRMTGAQYTPEDWKRMNAVLRGDE